jgi:hypothetical protein
MFRGSVKGKEWEHLKNYDQDNAMNITRALGGGGDREDAGSIDLPATGKMERGFDNPKAG